MSGITQGAVERSGSTGLGDVVELILDKGLVTDHLSRPPERASMTAHSQPAPITLICAHGRRCCHAHPAAQRRVSARPRWANTCRAVRPGPFSFLAGAVLASLADLLADGAAPSWVVRVGTCLELHFPACDLRLCLDGPGLLLEEPCLRLFAIFPGPAAKQSHGAAKQTHSVIVDRLLADFSPSQG